MLSKRLGRNLKKGFLFSIFMSLLFKSYNKDNHFTFCRSIIKILLEILVKPASNLETKLLSPLVRFPLVNLVFPLARPSARLLARLSASPSV